VKPSLYHWAGQTVLSDTVLDHKRTVAGRNGGTLPCKFDIRRWVLPPDDDLMGDTWQRIAVRHRKHLAAAPTRALDDLKAKAVWHFAIEHIEFAGDYGPDFWQLPPETLALGHGDCEDQAFLTASLLLAAGIPHEQVRVALGALVRREARSAAQSQEPSSPGLSPPPACARAGDNHTLRGHAWPMYRDSHGRWRSLETSLLHLPVARDGRVAQAKRPVGIDRAVLLSADALAAEGRRNQYVPLICLNYRHVWTVPPATPDAVAAATLVHPDWAHSPSFRQLWSHKQRLLRGLDNVASGADLLD
jgi:hypothetical protein